MNNILDEIDNDTIRTKTFSKLSFGMALFMLILGAYFNSLIPENVAQEGFPIVSPMLIWLGRLSIPISFIFSVISFIKREPSSFIKWAGGIFNTLIVIIAAFVLLFWFKK
jgi:hypothetical protein